MLKLAPGLWNHEVSSRALKTMYGGRGCFLLAGPYCADVGLKLETRILVLPGFISYLRTGMFHDI